MSDHLPECFANEALKHGPCICDRLRQAEQRKVLEAVKPVSQAYDEGYAAGVQAARDAVAALRGLQYDEESVVYKGAALFAIDALREADRG